MRRCGTEWGVIVPVPVFGNVVAGKVWKIAHPGCAGGAEGWACVCVCGKGLVLWLGDEMR